MAAQPDRLAHALTKHATPLHPAPPPHAPPTRHEILRAIAARVDRLVKIEVSPSGADRQLLIQVAIDTSDGERKFADRMPEKPSSADIENVVTSLNFRIGRLPA
jgi:hypothetical protein